MAQNSKYKWSKISLPLPSAGPPGKGYCQPRSYCLLFTVSCGEWNLISQSACHGPVGPLSSRWSPPVLSTSFLVRLFTPQLKSSGPERFLFLFCQRVKMSPIPVSWFGKSSSVMLLLQSHSCE